MTEETKKFSIICFSGDFDRVMAAFILATGGVAFDYEVSMFFTFWGLNVLKKQKGRKPIGKNFLEKAFNVMMGGRDKMPLSKFNFGGMGPKLMQDMMAKKKITSVEELLRQAVEFNVKIYACEMAMTVMGIQREDLIDEITDVVGVASFLASAEDGQVLFI